MNDISGVVWNFDKDEPFKKIILLDKEKNLLFITLPLKLYAGYNLTQVQLTKKAIYKQLSQITGLSKNISCQTFSSNITFPSDNWENALSLSLLLAKILTLELDLKEIKKNNLIQIYEDKIKINEEKYYQEFKEIISQ